VAQPENSLHAAGWRQGSFFKATIALCVATQHGAEHTEHDFWVVSSQDCDLAKTATDSDELVEVRPIFPWEKQLPMSIRNRRFPIVGGACVDWRAPKVSICANALSTFTIEGAPSTRHRRYFKTWLGRGYDRPAVPVAQVPVAEAVAIVVKKMDSPEIDAHIRDVLMVFNGDDPSFVELYAVVLQESRANLDAISIWVNAVAMQVSERGFTVGRREARLESEISLLVIENSYAANLSDITTNAEENAGAAR
jgi:hypothetical protein